MTVDAGLVTVRDVAAALRLDQATVRRAVDALGVPVSTGVTEREPAILGALVPLCLAIPNARWQRAYVDFVIAKLDGGSGVNLGAQLRRGAGPCRRTHTSMAMVGHPS